MKKLLMISVLLLSFIPVAESANASLLQNIPGVKCWLSNYKDCNEIEAFPGCISTQGPGPGAFQGCCRTPPWKGFKCICDTIDKIYLPTTIIYTVPEDIYGANPDAGFGTNSKIQMNHVILSMNPNWVLLFGYGYSGCYYTAKHGRIPPIPVPTLFGADKKPNKVGIIDSLKDMDYNAVPRVTRSRVDDRLLASTYVALYAALENMGFRPEDFKVSLSPYAETCSNISKTDFSVIDDPDLAKDYTTFGNFINKYDEDIWKKVLENIVNVAPLQAGGFYNRSCKDEAVTLETRPVYFVYEEYRMTVRKGQLAPPAFVK